MSKGQVDWSAIHRRLEAVNMALTRGFAPGPDERKRILKDRADRLARPPRREGIGDTIELVEFKLAGEHYGLEIRHVREVYPLKDFTPLPGTPAFVLGLINVRGQIISVIDIKKFFELPEKGITALDLVIIIGDEHMEFGILADEVLDVKDIDPKEIQPSLPTLKGVREEFLRGITLDRMVVLDAKKLLSAKNIIVHEEI